MRNHVLSALAISSLLSLAQIGCSATAAEDEAGAATGAASEANWRTVRAGSSPQLSLLAQVRAVDGTAIDGPRSVALTLNGKDFTVFEVSESEGVSALYISVFTDTYRIYKIASRLSPGLHQVGGLTRVDQESAGGIKIIAWAPDDISHVIETQVSIVSGTVSIGAGRSLEPLVEVTTPEFKWLARVAAKHVAATPRGALSIFERFADDEEPGRLDVALYAQVAAGETAHAFELGWYASGDVRVEGTGQPFTIHGTGRSRACGGAESAFELSLKYASTEDEGAPSAVSLLEPACSEAP